MTPLERLAALGLPESELDYWRRMSEGLSAEGRKKGREARAKHAEEWQAKAREIYAMLHRQRSGASLKALAVEVCKQLQALRVTKKNGEPYKVGAIYRFLLR